jgi:hypothetical protein
MKPVCGKENKMDKVDNMTTIELAYATSLLAILHMSRRGLFREGLSTEQALRRFTETHSQVLSIFEMGEGQALYEDFCQEIMEYSLDMLGDYYPEVENGQSE